MKILEKYILSNFVSAFLFCITLLMVLGIVGDILGFLDDIVKNNIPLNSILSFYFYLAPFAFVNMVPFACLLSAVYVFNTFSKNQEVTAVIASGVSLWKLLKPVILVTFLLCLFTFIVNDRIVPSTMEKSSRIRNEELEQGQGDAARMVMKDLAIYGKGEQIIYAKKFNTKTHVFNNMIIHRRGKEQEVSEKITACEVKLNNGKWIGEDVIVFKADADGVFRNDPVVYPTMDLEIKESPKDFINNQWDPRFMSYGQLKRYLKIFKFGSKTTTRRLLVDLNYKLALPFTALITVLVGVPFSIETGRASALIGMARGIMIAILYLPIMAVSLALGKGGVLPPVLAAWLCNIIFGIFGIYNINKKS
ncbi:MAG: LptF/LptG family permease [Candidatus Omnitrophota bacterium]